jgi:hypothetical protein
MTTRLVAFSLATFSTFSICACTKPTPEGEPAAASPLISTQPTPVRDVRALVGKLGVEADHRPKAGVTAEQLFDALDGAGVKLTSRTQYVGEIMKAKFCAGGRTLEGLVVAMCEYGSDREAAAGLAYMNSTFAFAAATRQVHRAAVMTVVNQSHAHDDLVARAFTTFETL